jgi:hypothetical protein
MTQHTDSLLTLGSARPAAGPSIRYATTTSSVRAYDLAVEVPRGFHRYLVRADISPTGTRPPAIGVTLTNYLVSPHAQLRTDNVLLLHTCTKGVFRGRDYIVRVWIGRTVSARDRAALLRALASVRPAQ